MARPRVFISSTHHDLKHVRAAVGDAVAALGFEPVLSENGGIAYASDRALDESCYREVDGCDLFVLIVGRRYGSQVSAEPPVGDVAFQTHYSGITHAEFRRARLRNLPTYVAIDNDVYKEFEFFHNNQQRRDLVYQVESANVFRLIAEVLAQSNVPVLRFDRSDEIQAWLRAQWAGSYRDLLGRQSEFAQLAGLAAQVAELREISATLKRYLEAVLTAADPRQSATLIAEEDRRLDVLRDQSLRANAWSEFMERAGVRFADYRWSLQHAANVADFLRLLRQRGLTEPQARLVQHMLALSWAQRDINEARAVLQLTPFADLPAAGTARKRSSASRVAPHSVGGDNKSVDAKKQR
ncbi:DUF4062 domain-containing protein [Aetokthonos hydrillicola Thurmond2011]|uniref:DUF4062 domain-containing protein n=1 Tax=Aetokthonos hydrillicola Thurmond2011 TaxID=2712845 RepID=A0AAP5MAB1_9CYAN|nr:DUF4062 domain-containing protein [Aetokthonos hydrillicola]MDR9900981.1 DUF4062 domain-containing protein [Aetokthonos hydrillicola Thurmond2011]